MAAARRCDMTVVVSAPHSNVAVAMTPRADHVMVTTLAPVYVTDPTVAVVHEGGAVMMPMTCRCDVVVMAASMAMNRRGGGVRIVMAVPVVVNLRHTRNGESEHRDRERDQERDPAFVAHVSIPSPRPATRSCSRFNTPAANLGKSSLIKPGPNASAQAAWIQTPAHAASKLSMPCATRPPMKPDKTSPEPAVASQGVPFKLTAARPSGAATTVSGPLSRTTA